MSVWTCGEGGRWARARVTKRKAKIFKLPPKVIKNVVVAAGDVAGEATANVNQRGIWKNTRKYLPENTHTHRHTETLSLGYNFF